MVDNREYTLKMVFMDPKVPMPTSFDDQRANEYNVNFKEFSKLDKVDFYNKDHDMLLKEVNIEDLNWQLETWVTPFNMRKSLSTLQLSLLSCIRNTNCIKVYL